MEFRITYYSGNSYKAKTWTVEALDFVDAREAFDYWVKQNQIVHVTVSSVEAI